MRIRTTTAQINDALPMMEVVKAEHYNKDTFTTTAIDTEIFTENMQFLAESGKLTDCMGWTYERNPGSKSEYIFETGRMNAECDGFLTIWMRLKDGVSMNEIEKILLLTEED